MESFCMITRIIGQSDTGAGPFRDASVRRTVRLPPSNLEIIPLFELLDSFHLDSDYKPKKSPNETF